MKIYLYLTFIAATLSLNSVAQNKKNEVTELNLQAFKQKVWNFDRDKTFSRANNLPIILDFYATWCRPCKLIVPHLDAIQKKYKGKLMIYRIDVDKEPEIAQKFNILAMPTIVFIGNQTKYNKELGYREFAELDQLVQKYIFNLKK